ncbi:DUF1679 and EcKinase domain containing protein [Trichuris trichiura]|uniref:DUF1679 and EcKinase domain containing protein n=1 Tax=Trichuris trichiura TaxID=36087 RepID=A0A077Z1T4_TRITR|nr:DUF1679 and EcKinase domain containing protein [Trichuris trichiura]
MVQDALTKRIPLAASNLRSVSAESIGCGKGYLSEVLRVELQWKETVDNVKLPTHIIVKTTCSEKLSQFMKRDETTPSEEEATRMAMELFHNTECAVYELFNTHPPDIPLATCYSAIPMGAADKPPMIVLQDLHEYGKHQPIKKGLTVDQLYEVADKLAALHAWSLTTNCGWREKLALGFRSVMPDVIVNGDLCSNNLIFSTDEKTGSASRNLIAMIDWQICHQGPFAEDLCNLLSCSVAKWKRRKYTKPVFKR